ncbi:uncharacterized protein LOC6537453 [Drosophila yakuba]|uniref:Uncharacterized protein, isoform A n=1 Tax=Drosophila yakuba TaxID=7245 RepID=B4PU71_DROYA|nr:uncharacterized protein LOC6537453 [Drosophila yakuba]EDW97721.1 uncharacterized protein Dyak_GE24173, isoform A [Drosophila yakuba]
MLELQLCGDLSAGDMSEIPKMGHQRATDTGHRQIRSHRKSDCRTLPTRCLLLLLGALLLSMELVECALRNVNLIIEPPAVRRGQHVVLRCMYDLEGAPLYSAKFYRGQLEFYRYTPGEFPNTKVFPFPGIHVDVSSSNATQVLLRNVGFGLSGNFSCEVTADAPLFSTATAVDTMQVVELPEKRPQVFTEHTRYEPGDVLRANCSTPPSRPRAELTFTINNLVMSNVDIEYIRTIDNLIATRISLKMQLQGIHFSSVNPVYNNGYGPNSVYGHGGPAYAPNANPGGLLLRCSAQIGELYQEFKEIELGTPQKDPVPARVTLSSDTSFKSLLSSYFSTSAAAASRLLPGVYMAPLIMAMLASLFRLIEAAFEPCDASSQDPQPATGHSMEHSKERGESKEQRSAPVSSCSAFKASRQQLAWPGSRTESLDLGLG